MVKVVVGVLRDSRGCYLIGRRAGKAYHGCWEFPGGKIEPDEKPEAALVREWHEELDVTVSVGARVYTGRFTTTDLVDFELLAYMVAFVPPGRQQGVSFTAHDSIRWATKSEILSIPPGEVTPSLWPITEKLA